MKTTSAVPATPAAPRRRNTPARALLQGLVLVIVAWLATQVYYFAQIGWWTRADPATTAYMRAASWRLAHAGGPSDIAHVWVPYAQVSRNLKRAIIASEDATFVNNPGFDTDAMLQAWERNRRHGRMERGGSGITQQLARNLFLS
ncbi:MAG: transglycosylase domain-containing protein, partial [Janthinobacterium lividum]